jgi:putative ABC transport system permease protein
MIRSILKLIWKRKRHTSLMVIEMFISFLILFALLTVIVNYSYQYYESKGFDHNNVWVADIRYDKENDESGKTLRELMDLTKKNVLSIQGVSAVSNCSNNLPYGMSTTSSSMKYGEVQYHDINILRTDENFHKVFQIDIAVGSWYKIEDLTFEEIPIVVNKEFKELFFPNESVLGKKMTTGFNSDKFRIVGYIENFKIDGELSKKKATCFRMVGGTEVANRLIIRTENGANKTIEEQLVNILTSTSKNWQINLKSMDVYKTSDFKRKLIPLIIFLSVAVFLVVNIILGLFGTLLYNINQRKPEIGLRRSVGAPALKIYQQFIGEMLILTTMGIIPALIVAVQFPILKVFEICLGVYVSAIVFSAAIIYLLVFIASYMPSRYAAKIQPAIALHEE